VGLQFEIERRIINFHKDTSMPDGSQLGFDNDPNTALNGATPGETLIYNCPQHSRFAQSDGIQWYKKESPNLWEQFGGDSGGGEIDGGSAVAVYLTEQIIDIGGA